MRKKSNFATGFIIYMVVLSVLIMGGLALLWVRMDVYEKSRPDSELKRLVRDADSAYWHRLLMEKGMSEGYVSTLDLEDVSFHKNMGLYTEAAPVYGIRFGGSDVLIARFKMGEELMFGEHAWELEDISLTIKGLYVYAPQDAIIRVNGKAFGREYMVEENAQKLQLGIFDENRDDVPQLMKYELTGIYEIDGVSVEDGGGNELLMSHSSGISYYYVPYMSDYKIVVPSDCGVMVNDILLSEANAKLENVENEDFEGIEDFVASVPVQTTYTVEGLIMPPEVKAVTAEGRETALTLDGDSYFYDSAQLPPAELADYILEMFDAYTAYNGNRGKTLTANYNRCMSYLVPGSEAAERVEGAKSSIVYAKYVKVTQVSIGEYTPYSDDLFTCRIDFKLEGSSDTDGVNSYLFIFVKQGEAWKVVRILNKTAFF